MDGLGEDPFLLGDFAYFAYFQGLFLAVCFKGGQHGSPNILGPQTPFESFLGTNRLMWQHQQSRDILASRHRLSRWTAPRSASTFPKDQKNSWCCPRWSVGHPNRIPSFYGNGMCIYVVIYLFTVLFTYVGYLTLRQYLAKCRSKYTIFMGPFGHGRRTFFGLQGFHPASFGNLSAAQKPVTNGLIHNSNPYKWPYNEWAPGFFSPYL